MLQYTEINAEDLKQNIEIHNHSTRHILNLDVQIFWTNAFKKSVASTD
jgi:hypothetical protein